MHRRSRSFASRMPTMSSRSSSITGKRECPDSTTVGRMLRGRIVAPDEHHLRARHHDVAHLEVARPPARPRAWSAHRHRAGRARRPRAASPSSSSRSCGSPREALGESLQPAAGRVEVLGHQAAPIGIGEAQAAQHRDLTALHAVGVRVALVIVADEVQRAVHDEVRPVRAQALAAARGLRRAAPADRSPDRPAGAARRPRGRQLGAPGNDSTLVGLSLPR